MRQQPQQKPQKQMSSSEARVRGLLAQNADEAFGVTPAPEGAAPAGETQEVAEISGLLSNLKENPMIAGGVTFVGLIMLYIGLALRDPLSALATQAIGFVLFMLGGIYTVGHMRTMWRNRR